MKPTDLPPIAALQAVQEQLENEAVQIGKDQYEQLKDTRGEVNTGPGTKLLKALVLPLAASIQQLQQDALSGKAGRGMGKAKFLLQFEPEVVAYITAKVAMQHCDQEIKVQTAALAIARLLEDTVCVDRLKIEAPRTYHFLMQRIKSSGEGGQHKHFVIKAAGKRHQIETIKWTEADRLGLGIMLLRMLEDSSGAIVLARKFLNKGTDTPIFLEATPDTREWLNKGHDNAALLQPVKRPMVVPPLPWNSLRGGGYITKHLKYTAVTARNGTHLQQLKAWDMPKVYRALNALQETPWAVNKAVLQVLEQVWAEGGHLGGLPPVDNIPLPPQTYGTPEENPEGFQQWKSAAKDVHERNAKLQNERITTARKLDLAKRFAEFDAIYFPHVMDWRGRMYPVSAFLNPQGDDAARGLLHFSRGKALGPNGRNWLAIHGANCAGVDKVSFEERIKWVEEHRAHIIDSALNPLDGGRFWSTVDSPWQFLAFCFEWLGASLQGEAYVSHLSVSWDGSCNGLQNYSAMLKDEVGGKATNLIPSETPSDIYTEVAEEVERLLPPGSAWKGKVTRGVTKRPTMTLPYGAGRYGFTSQIRETLLDLDDKAPSGSYLPHGDNFENARTMAEVVDHAIANVVVKAREAMDWLKEVAKIAASDKLPIYWQTPSGFRAIQNYRSLIGKRVAATVAGEKIRLMLQVESEELDTNKQVSAIAPNFIHSMDASHMVNTINRCLDKGITGLAMIHDSYGTHAADAETLSVELREAFIEQYTPDVLGNFLEQIKGQLPPELIDKLPPRPELGNLDLEQVRHSKYFFG